MSSLFDPEPEIPSPQKPSPQPSGPLSVSDLAAGIQDALSQGLPRRVWVSGEVANFTDRGHWWFSLREGDAASLSCVMWRSRAQAQRENLSNGVQVEAWGKVDYYAGSGRLQLVIDRVQMSGQGDLEAELQSRLERLRESGVLDRPRQTLPLVPKGIVIVTSRSAAALQDVIATARQRWPGVQLYLWDARVQGAAAAPEIANALRAISQKGAACGLDVVLLTRGGGSIEDLWAFNEMEVVDAVVSCTLPVVAAIGHETDVTLAELAADCRASTPTQAAMTLTPDSIELRDRLGASSRRIWSETRHQMQNSRRRIDMLSRLPFLRDPLASFAPMRQRMRRAQERLDSASQHQLRNAHQQLQHMQKHPAFQLPETTLLRAQQGHARARQRFHCVMRNKLTLLSDRLTQVQKRLHALSPDAVLQRGYAYVTDDNGIALGSKAEVASKERVNLHLADGKIEMQPTKREK